jgi:hypothetical protein
MKNTSAVDAVLLNNLWGDEQYSYLCKGIICEKLITQRIQSLIDEK